MQKKPLIPQRHYTRSSSCKHPNSNTQHTTNSSSHIEKPPSQSKQQIQKNLQLGPNSYLKKIFETLSVVPSNHQNSVLSKKSLASRTVGRKNNAADLGKGAFSAKHSAIQQRSPSKDQNLKSGGVSPSPVSSILPSFHSVAMSVDEEGWRRNTEILLPWQKLMREFDRLAEVS